MKPYLLFKNKLSPYWYAQIRLPDGTLTSNKSTRDEITSIISTLKERRIITSAIRPEHKSDRDLIEYLEFFNRQTLSIKECISYTSPVTVAVCICR